MFGYIKTYTPELKVLEYEYYRGAYCGLCRSMGKCTGQCSRFTLSYDFAFLALIRLALSETDVKFKRRRCIAHPFHKRKMLERNDELDYCAYAAAILAHHKLSDDISDERGLKRIEAYLGRPFTSHMRKKALKGADIGELDSFIAERLAELSAFEASGEASVDMPADIFGELLAKIVSFGFEGDKKKIAHNIGYHIGRWIYITDALDDLDEDTEKGRYNPFRLIYPEKPDKRERALIIDALKNELCDATAALDLIDFGENKTLENIISNIFYLGMPKKLEEVISEKEEAKKNCGRKDNLKTDE